MVVLKDECSNLSTVLGAVRELEMAQRSVCVWQGECECVPTSKLPLILLSLVNLWLAPFPGLPHFFLFFGLRSVQYMVYLLPCIYADHKSNSKKKQGGLGTRLVLDNDSMQECIKMGSLSKSMCLCACVRVCVCVLLRWITALLVMSVVPTPRYVRQLHNCSLTTSCVSGK